MNKLSYLLSLLIESGFKANPKSLTILTDELQLNRTFFTDPTILNKTALKKLLNSLNSKLNLNPEKINKAIHNNSAELYQNLLNKHAINLVNYFEAEYPPLLKELYDPPLLLYYQGDLKITQLKTIAVVGNRKATQYGKLATKKILSRFENSAICIVSGMAYGIDSEAHHTALNLNLPTIAVLGNGLSKQSIYPKVNLSLAENIFNSGGLIISEYPPLNTAHGYQFIARNRIIAGLSQLTLIIECQKKSGALITAEFATELGRPVAAIPGSVLSGSSDGPNNLIKQGALAITDSEDLATLLQINLKEHEKENKPSLSKIELLVLKCMQKQEVSLDEIAFTTNLQADTLLATISNLELKGLIISPSPGTYLPNHG